MNRPTVSPTMTPAPACRKCAGHVTHRHHSKCPKRGLGHRGRGERALWVETIGANIGVPVKVRRGRRGTGRSMPAAELHLRSQMEICPHHGTAWDLRRVVADSARVAPSRVQVANVAPGVVRITVHEAIGARAAHEAQVIARENIPGMVSVEVRVTPGAGPA